MCVTKLEAVGGLAHLRHAKPFLGLSCALTTAPLPALLEWNRQRFHLLGGRGLLCFVQLFDDV